MGDPFIFDINVWVIMAEGRTVALDGLKPDHLNGRG